MRTLHRIPTVLYHVGRIALSLLFIYSAASKLSSLHAFTALISDYGIVYPAAELPVAILIALLEAGAGLGLLLEIRGSLAILVALLVVFGSVLMYGIHLGLDVECGCLTIGDPGSGPEGLRNALLRDGGLLALCLFLYGYRRWRGVEPVGLREWGSRWMGESR